MTMGDYSFVADKIHTVATQYLKISDDIMNLPYLPGHGMVYDSWQSMTRDSSGVLKELIQNFSAEENLENRSKILDQILYKWTGCQDIDPGSRGNNINARQLAVLEKFYGETYGEGNPNIWNGPILAAKYQNVKKYYEGWLLGQTHVAGLFKDIKYSIDNTGKIVMDFSVVKQNIENNLNSNYQKGKEQLREFTSSMSSMGIISNYKEYNDFCDFFINKNNDLLEVIYSAGKNLIVGTTSNDVLYGDGVNDMILGGDGNDSLYACGGNVVLDGGNGNDVLYGEKGINQYRWGDDASNGNVTYLWGKGSGNDIIINVSNDFIKEDKNSGQSIICLGAEITKDKIDFIWNQEDLILKNKENNETLTIKNWTLNDYYKIDEIHFSDGSKVATDEITKLAHFDTTNGNDTLCGSDYRGDTINGGDGADTLYGQGGNDTIYGGNGDDTLYGGVGNDILYGGDGEDTLYGGTGNDILDGGAGNDTLSGAGGDDIYIWGVGSGNDTINNSNDTYRDAADNSWKYNASGHDTVKFGPGLTKENIMLTQEKEDVIFINKETGEKLTISKWFIDDAYKIEKFQFADGSSWTGAEISARVTVQGGAGNDVLHGSDCRGDIINGGDGNDTLYGGGGNDILDGGAGNDTLSGDGGDDIYLWGKGSGNDTIDNSNGRDFDWDNRCWKNNASGHDTVKFGPGLTKENIMLTQKEEDVIFINKETGESLTISNWFKDDVYKIEKFQFADGSSWAGAEISTQVTVQGGAGKDVLCGSDYWGDTINGGDGADTLYGQGGNDTLYGGDGNDTLYGGGGNDILDGGAGNDTLYGGAGNNLYIFGLGSGKDIISNNLNEVKSGINTLQFSKLSQAEISFGLNQKDLICTIDKSGESVCIENWMQNNNTQIDIFNFSNGNLTANDISQKILSAKGAGV